MDKEEFRIKLEEINRLVEKKDYKAAMEVVDSIDWRRVKNVHTLCVVGEIYAANKRYEDSKEIFLLAYHRAPIGKNILYRLIEVSLKMKDVDEAMDFYEEYLEVAPNDSTQYVLKYKIYKVKQAPLDEQIKILEDYKEHEFTEKWSYELAKLYYQNGDKDKCLDLCNEMILWFSDGKYVIKAMELKKKMGALSEREKETLENQKTESAEKEVAKTTEDTTSATSETEDTAESDDANEEAVSEKEDSSEENYEDNAEEIPLIDGVKIDQRDVNNAESLQERISKGISDIFSGMKKKAESVGELTEEEKEEDIEEEPIQEEMIKDISSKEITDDVPALEQEVSAKDKEIDLAEATSEIEQAEEKAEEKIKEKEKADLDSLLDLVDDDSEDDGTEESIDDLDLDGKFDTDSSEDENSEDEIEIKTIKSDSDFEFNLEDTILAAASAQGIDIPDDPEPTPEESSNRTKETASVDEEEEEPMTEEDLKAAEEEFLNGPSDKTSADEEEDELSKLLNTDDDEDDFSDLDFEDDDTEEDGKVDQEAKELEKFVDSINPKEDEDIIVPRENKLSDKEVKLFTYFAKVPGLKEQILNTLSDVQLCASDKTSKTGNIIVMGGRETGKTRLISGLIPAICDELNIEASKVAYVFADQINGKDIASIVNKLSGGFLVIENANQLDKDTVNELNKAMEFRTDGLIVIIEDEKIGMRKLIARFPKFTSKFTSMINIPVFTNDELVNFAKVYTRENGYTIDQMGMLALYNQISMGQKADQPMSVGSVKELIDNAIAKSKGGLRKLKKKKVNHDGYVVLYEKDFS